MFMSLENYCFKLWYEQLFILASPGVPFCISVLTVINVSKAEGYMFSRKLIPYGSFTVSGAEMVINIPRHFCYNVLFVIFEVEHPRDSETRDNYKYYPIQVSGSMIDKIRRGQMTHVTVMTKCRISRLNAKYPK